MKAALFIVLVILASLISSIGFAADPVIATTSDAPEVSPAPRSDLIESCERLVLRGLQMVLYRDHESGQLATVKFEPNLSLGGKVGLTYRF